MPNIIEVKYNKTGESTKTNRYGMREMQERAYEYRDSQYLLIKAPPASGKSRALMFIALDKLKHQGIKKAIIAVPERSIGGSFAPCELSKFGFYADWEPEDTYNLCLVGNDKVDKFISFIKDEKESNILICTHSTLRYAYEQLEETDFNDCMVAIDEFHHVSADIEESRLGEMLRSIMTKSNAHIVAMTGSYFRGDGVPVLNPEDEAKFDKVTYTYYDQLNGYNYLQTLGIGYNFYNGRYYTPDEKTRKSALEEVLDTDKKTILYIPNVNSAESSKEKYEEVGHIIDMIGDIVSQDKDTALISVKRKDDGRIIKIIDLVDETDRDKKINYLRTMKNLDDLDLIIALGMAKEGFDWPYCEHTLAIGYRGSLTEVIQIIGRCTRDSNNKTHAQFTNLIAQPDAENELITVSVNNMLKAITCSLLMEQVLAPNFKFKTRLENDKEPNKKGEIKIRGFKTPSDKVKTIIESDLNDLKAKIFQDDKIIKALATNAEPEFINKDLIPRVIQTAYPDLEEDEIEQLRQYVVADSVIKNSEIKEGGDKKFIRIANSFINIDDLEIDLIDKINPFQRAFEILSKDINARKLKAIQDAIESTRLQLGEEEALYYYKKAKAFKEITGKNPNIKSNDETEQKMAQAILYIRNKIRESKKQ